MLKRLSPILAFTAACWLVFAANHFLWHDQLNRFGIIPRRLASLPGILWAPFLHGSFEHLLANTLPLLVLGSILCLRGRREFFVLAGLGTILAGGLTWLVARHGSHIGASGLVFCWFGYLTSLAYFKRTLGTLLLSLVCLLFYGGMLRGVIPSALPVSWEGHLAGLVAGVGLAASNSRLTRPGRSVSTLS